MLFYAVLAGLFVKVLPFYFNWKGYAATIGMRDIVPSVLLYLGISFAAGFLARLVLRRLRGNAWYERVCLPAISPVTLVARLLTIVLMFSLQGEALVRVPLDVLRIALPLALYFASMFVLSFVAGKHFGATYAESAT